MEFPDNHENFDIVEAAQTVVEDAVDYLVTGGSYTRFPGAARAVAVATADFVSRKFKEDFFEVLSEKDLMHGNDPYFKTYNQDQEVYDQILQRVPLEKINWSSDRMQITKRLLLEEYLLDRPGLEILPYD